MAVRAEKFSNGYCDSTSPSTRWTGGLVKPRVRGECKPLQTEATGGLVGWPIYSSERPTADVIMMMIAVY